MALKQNAASSRPSGLLSNDDPFSGAWGNMVAPGQSVLAVRFWKVKAFGEFEHHSYPYRMLSHWCWEKAIKETLEVYGPGGVVTVHGHCLDKLAEALDEGRLRTVIEPKSADDTVLTAGIYVSAIDIKQSNKNDPKKCSQ